MGKNSCRHVIDLTNKFWETDIRINDIESGLIQLRIAVTMIIVIVITIIVIMKVTVREMTASRNYDNEIGQFDGAIVPLTCTDASNFSF